MSIAHIQDAFREAAAGKEACRRVTMKYADGGKQQIFSFEIVGRPEPVEVVWSGSVDNAALALLALKAI